MIEKLDDSILFGCKDIVISLKTHGDLHKLIYKINEIIDYINNKENK